MSSDHVLHLDAQSFDNVLKTTQTALLVDFWAPWCGPCKAIAPILDELAQELAGKATIAKVNVDENQDLAARFGVRAIPTLIIFKNGEIVEQMVGLKSKGDLLSKLQ